MFTQQPVLIAFRSKYFGGYCSCDIGNGILTLSPANALRIGRNITPWIDANDQLAKATVTLNTWVVKVRG